MQDAALEMDPVADLLGGGRTIAYKAALAHACGGATVGLLLSQLWYWTNTPSVRERSGWFWKTMDEITEETGLTRTEQESARKKLKQLGVLTEEFRDLPRKLYFRIDKGRLYEVLRDQIDLSANENKGGDGRKGSSGTGTDKAALYNAGNPQYGSGETRNMERRKSALLPAANPQAIVSEITTKSSSKNTTTNSPARLDTRAGLDTHVAAVENTNEDTEGIDAIDATDNIADQLAKAGVGRLVAGRLAAAYPEECRVQLAYLPYATDIRSSPGAYLRKAIEEGFGPPAGWTAEQRKQTKRTVKQTRTDSENALKLSELVERAQREEVKNRLREEQPALWQNIMTRAEQMLAPPIRSRPGSPAYRAAIEYNLDVIVTSLPHSA